MFEAAELGRKVSKEEYGQQVPGLRAELLDVQGRLREAPFPVLILFAGVDAAGKSETVNLLNEWMDPRWIVTRAFGEPSDEERERPEYWRFWREVPPRGRIGLFLGAWYSNPVLDRVKRRIGAAAFERRLDQIAEFERTLTEDGALILKFWMHLDKEAQRKRLKALENNPLTRWRVSKEQWKNWELYGRFIAAAETAIRRTSDVNAAWTIVEGRDAQYRSLTVGTMIRDAVRRRLAEAEVPRGKAVAGLPRQKAAPKRRDAASAALGRLAQHYSLLGRLDTAQAIPKNIFDVELEKYQGRLNLLQRRLRQKGISTILVFEGWDAAGKGGAIRRVTAALDARSWQVIPIAAPTDEERAHHYLWRFWRHLARAGRVTIFDRSWYGRVLVERIEEFATPAEWMRAYSEINQFEEQMHEHGIVLVKYWLHITTEEQERRFREREKSPYKSYKLTVDDWRNRAKWDAYELAVNDMVERTSTRIAPWTLVEANDKNFARIKILKTMCDRLTAAVG